MTEPRPWYRQFWPWFLIGIPVLGMLMSITTALTAISGADAEVPRTEPAMSRSGGVQQAGDATNE